MKVLLILFSVIPSFAFGQELLTLDESINIALSDNLGIEVAKLEQSAVEMQVYRSNAGFGPSVELGANLGATVNQVKQNYLDGRVVDRLGRSYAPNISVGLDWTVYDGGRMQATFDRLKKMAEVSDIETQMQMQELVVEVIEGYYEVMQLKAKVNFLTTVIGYYEDRLRITEERWHVGKGSKIDFLQSRTDLNAQLAERSVTSNDFKNAKVRLNGLLNRNLQIDFDVEDSVQFNETYVLETLINAASEKNRDVLLLRKYQDVNILSQKQLEADKKPRVGFSSTLGYSYNNTNASFVLSNQNLSLNAGFGARWTLFDGDHINKQIGISKVNSQSLMVAEEELLTRIRANLTAAYNQYLSDKEMLTFEEENKDLAEENLSISLQKFKLGNSTILELNESQRSYDSALDRLVDAQHNIRVSELQLLELSGELVR